MRSNARRRSSYVRSPDGHRDPGVGAPGSEATSEATRLAVERVVREEAARLTATLVRTIGDFDLAEELVQDALVTALEHWPREGIPDNPAAWLTTTARRKGIDRLRREARYRDKLAKLAEREEATEVSDYMPRVTGTSTIGSPDERLDLIFTCCHPALAREAQVALTLRAVLGLTTAEIARAFLVSEATLAQRIVRAKRKIVEAGIRFRTPDPSELPLRLADVLTVLYLVFNEGYLASGPERASRRDLAEDAEWLVALVVRLLPDEPEPLGLLALMRLHLARADARFDERGDLVLLKDQDRSRWDHARIAEAAALLERAARMRRPSPYQLQAAIAAVHAQAPTWDGTDWPVILRYYDQLLAMTGSPVVRLNRAIALRYVAGPASALKEVDAIVGLERYHLYHATRGEFLRALERPDEAREADRRALELTDNPAERALLETRIAGH